MLTFVINTNLSYKISKAKDLFKLITTFSMNHVYTYQARRDVLTRKQNELSSTFVSAVLVFYKLLELNEI